MWAPSTSASVIKTVLVAWALVTSNSAPSVPWLWKRLPISSFARIFIHAFSTFKILPRVAWNSIYDQIWLIHQHRISSTMKSSFQLGWNRKKNSLLVFRKIGNFQTRFLACDFTRTLGSYTSLGGPFPRAAICAFSIKKSEGIAEEAIGNLDYFTIPQFGLGLSSNCGFGYNWDNCCQIRTSSPVRLSSLSFSSLFLRA